MLLNFIWYIPLNSTINRVESSRDEEEEGEKNSLHATEQSIYLNAMFK